MPTAQKARETAKIAVAVIENSSRKMSDAIRDLDKAQEDLGPNGLDIAPAKLTARKNQIKADGEAELEKTVKMSLWMAKHFSKSIGGLTNTQRDSGAYTDTEAEDEAIAQDVGHLLTVPDNE